MEDRKKARNPIGYLDLLEIAAFLKNDTQAMLSLTRRIGRSQ